MKKWAKVKGVYNDIKSICESLEQCTKRCDHNLAPISIISPSDYSKRNLNELPPLFMYSQILKEILLGIQHNKNAKEELVKLWRKRCHDNQSQLEIDQGIRAKLPISFVHPVVHSRTFCIFNTQ